MGHHDVPGRPRQSDRSGAEPPDRRQLRWHEPQFRAPECRWQWRRDERYLLPNIIAYKVSVAGGNITRSVVDFSDRPQYVGAVCNSNCTETTVVFSTTPTGGQTGGFADKGTIRYENITRRSSHLFFEHATFLRDNKGDTLEVVRLKSGTYGSDSTLVPFPIRMDAPGFPTRDAGFLVTLADVGFRDTTFVRNSASFRRAIFGEGGVARGSRTLTYDADGQLRRATQQVVTDTTTGQVTTYTSQLAFVDAGVSPPSDVSDLIANAFSPVRGVAVSADGELFAIRADSTYLFNNTLRLYGLLQSQGGNAGFDFHPLNAPGANLSGGTLATRLSFAASREPVLEVFDTRCVQRVGVIAIKDPIIGPLKTAVRGSRIVAVVHSARMQHDVVWCFGRGRLPASCSASSASRRPVKVTAPRSSAPLKACRRASRCAPTTLTRSSSAASRATGAVGACRSSATRSSFSAACVRARHSAARSRC